MCTDPAAGGDTDAGAWPGTGVDGGGATDRDGSTSGGADSATIEDPNPLADAGTDNETDDGSTPATPDRSAGCGKAPSAGGTHTIDVGGTRREYIIKLPSNYDSNKPYRLIFAWHGLGGTASAIARSWYGLEARSQGSAIFVAGQGLQTSLGGAGWDNSGGRDVAFVKALVDKFRADYCIDNQRIFSVGMSFGGIMSNTLGCSMGDVFRAVAPMAGRGPGSGFGTPRCIGQVAVWLAHGRSDTFPGVSFPDGQASRDSWTRANNCDASSKPVSPGECIAYDGCDTGFPVHWCEFNGGHTVPSFAGEGIWNFFSQF